MVTGYTFEEAALRQIEEEASHPQVAEEGSPSDVALSLVGALLSVLHVHRPTEAYGHPCITCGGPWPCRTRKAIREELLTLAGVPRWTERITGAGIRF